MNVRCVTSEELLSALGKEREQYPQETAFAARAELTRRLGGTRAQALKRLRVWGAFLIAVGLFLSAAGVATAVLAPTAPGRRFGFGVVGAFGLCAVAVGVAFAKGKWTFHHVPWLIGSAERKALSADPPLEDMLSNVGPDRRRRSDAEVAEAENALLEWTRQAREHQRSRIKTWGAWAIGIGLYLGLTSILSVGQLIWMAQSPDGYWAGGGVASQLHFWMMVAMAGLNSCFGWGVFAAGMGLRRRSEWARRMLIWLLWTYFICALAFTPVLLAWMALIGMSVKDMLLLIPWLAAAVSFWWAIISGLTKPLQRPATVEAIDPALMERSEDVRRRLRRIITVEALVVGFIVVAAPVLLYGLWWRTSAG